MPHQNEIEVVLLASCEVQRSNHDKFNHQRHLVIKNWIFFSSSLIFILSPLSHTSVSLSNNSKIPKRTPQASVSFSHPHTWWLSSLHIRVNVGNTFKTEVGLAHFLSIISLIISHHKPHTSVSLSFSSKLPRKTPQASVSLSHPSLECSNPFIGTSLAEGNRPNLRNRPLNYQESTPTKSSLLLEGPIGNIVVVNSS